jgi:sRNA-binding regulator protein Hfq
MPPKSLLELAREKFGELSEAEEKLFEATEKGEVAEISKPDKRTDLSKVVLPVIRADRLVWLMTDRRARRRVTHKGVTVVGARIEGEIDLSFVDWPGPFSLLSCQTPSGLMLQNASFGLLHFGGTHTGPINADGITVKGDVFLRDGLSAQGKVRFLGAAIGGDFSCVNGAFNNDKGYALNADGIKVKGGMYLREGFSAQGEVRFHDADISGSFDCSNGAFSNEKGKALNADGIKVKGSVFLCDGVSAQGEVRFLGADIGGDFDCSKGEFNNENGYALSADRITVKGGVFLRDGFSAQGEVRFLGADIGGVFICTQGAFHNENGHALSAEKVTISGNVFLRGMTLHGKASLYSAVIEGGLAMDATTWENDAVLDLRQATIGILYDDNNWPKKGNFHLDGFRYEAIHDGSPLNARDRLEWLDRQPDDQFHPQPYEQLAKVLKQAGHEEAAREIQIAKNDKMRQMQPRIEWLDRLRERVVTVAHAVIPFDALARSDTVKKAVEWIRTIRELHLLRRVWYWLLKWLTGYGYRPGRIALCMLGVIFVGMIFFSLGNFFDSMTSSASFYVYEQKIGDDKPLPGTEEFKIAHKADGSLRHILTDDYPHFNALFYSIDTFLPLVDLNQQSYWMPNANTFLGGLLRWYLLFHILAGWFFTSLLVASFTGLIKQ